MRAVLLVPSTASTACPCARPRGPCARPRRPLIRDVLSHVPTKTRTYTAAPHPRAQAAGAASTDADDDLGGHLENLDDDFEPDFESEMDDLHIDADGDLDLEVAGGDYADDLIDDTDGESTAPLSRSCVCVCTRAGTPRCLVLRRAHATMAAGVW